MHCLSVLLGSTVTIETLNRNVYKGIFRTISRDCELVVELTHKVDPKHPHIIDPSTVQEKYIFNFNDLFRCSFFDVDMSAAVTTDIGQNNGREDSPNQEKECRNLELWEPDSNASMDKDLGEIEPSIGSNRTGVRFNRRQVSEDGWSAHDMFAQNEVKYGVKSTYDPDLKGYTVPLDRSSKAFKENEARASKVAREIENRGFNCELENGEEDEEAAFSAVVLPTSEATVRRHNSKESMHIRAGDFNRADSSSEGYSSGKYGASRRGYVASRGYTARNSGGGGGPSSFNRDYRVSSSRDYEDFGPRSGRSRIDERNHGETTGRSYNTGIQRGGTGSDHHGGDGRYGKNSYSRREQQSVSSSSTKLEADCNKLPSSEHRLKHSTSAVSKDVVSPVSSPTQNGGVTKMLKSPSLDSTTGSPPVDVQPTVPIVSAKISSTLNPNAQEFVYNPKSKPLLSSPSPIQVDLSVRPAVNPSVPVIPAGYQQAHSTSPQVGSANSGIHSQYAGSPQPLPHQVAPPPSVASGVSHQAPRFVRPSRNQDYNNMTLGHQAPPSHRTGDLSNSLHVAAATGQPLMAPSAAANQFAAAQIQYQQLAAAAMAGQHNIMMRMAASGATGMISMPNEVVQPNFGQNPSSGFWPAAGPAAAMMSMQPPPMTSTPNSGQTPSPGPQQPLMYAAPMILPNAHGGPTQPPPPHAANNGQFQSSVPNYVTTPHGGGIYVLNNPPGAQGQMMNPQFAISGLPQGQIPINPTNLQQYIHSQVPGQPPPVMNTQQLMIGPSHSLHSAGGHLMPPQ